MTPHRTGALPAIRDEGELERHISGTYFGLRWGMTLIGFGLPVVLITGGLSAGPDDGFTCARLCGSISAYYAAGTPLLRDLFVGALIAAAALLITYQGFSEAENTLLNVAGSLAVVVALVPTPHLVHRLAAVGLFLCMALVCWFRAGDTLPLIGDEEVRRRFAVRYKTQGAMMVGFPATALALALTFDRSILLLAVETAAIWVFGWYWLTKSRELQRTHADRRAAARELVVVPAGSAAGDPAAPAPAKSKVPRMMKGAFGGRAVVESLSSPRNYGFTARAAGAGSARGGGEGLAGGDEGRRSRLEDTAVRLPHWVRLLFAIFAPEFVFLAYWFTGMEAGNWGPPAGAVLSTVVAVVLLAGAFTGRIPRPYRSGSGHE